jgi:hypothetical protein
MNLSDESYPVDPMFALVRAGIGGVELRGFEPLTFSDRQPHWTPSRISINPDQTRTIWSHCHGSNRFEA